MMAGQLTATSLQSRRVGRVFWHQPRALHFVQILPERPRRIQSVPLSFAVPELVVLRYAVVEHTLLVHVRESRHACFGHGMHESRDETASIVSQ